MMHQDANIKHKFWAAEKNNKEIKAIRKYNNKKINNKENKQVRRKSLW